MLGDLVPASLHNKHSVFRCIILQNGLLLHTIIPCIIPLAIFLPCKLLVFLCTGMSLFSALQLHGENHQP